MQREVIVTGKTIEDAIETGLCELNLLREQVSVEVIDTPTRKLFGSTPAKVRVVSDEDEVQHTETLNKPQPQKTATPQPEIKRQTVSANTQTTQPKSGNLSNKSAFEEQRRQRSEAEHAALVEKIQVSEFFLHTVFCAMGMDNLKTTASIVDRGAVIEVVGTEVSTLIGRRGETMEALSYITSLVANQKGGSFEKISLNVAGYREKREEDLTSLANKIAANVTKNERAYALEPMNAYERRIIHTAIGEIEGIASQSSGEGTTRHVVIFSEKSGVKNTVQYGNYEKGYSYTRR